MDAALQIPQSFSSAAPGCRGEATCPPSISLVLPAYNEEAVIAQAIREADSALAQITNDYEVLVVDDGSRDDTLKIAQSEAVRYPSVRVLNHHKNRGYGAALRTGFAAATKDYIGFTDADCQFDLRQLNRLVLLLSSCDIACGYRLKRQDGYLRILYSRTYNVMVRLLLGIPVRDCDCALKLFRREVLQDVTIGTDGFLVNAELLTKAQLHGRQIVEVGVDHRVRAGGESTVSLRHATPVLLALLRFWWSHVQFPGRSHSRHLAAGRPVRLRSVFTALALALLCGLVFFARLSYPLIEPDENRYAQIALEMNATGDYLVPRLQGEPYLDKPPLLYWATAASFRFFGPSEISARLIPALAASWTVLVTFLLGQRLFGYRIALAGSILMFLCIGFVLTGRYLIMDGLLTCFTTTSLLAGALAIREERLHRGWWYAAAVACGLGVMTKGPIALVVTAPPLLVLSLLDQRVARITLRCALIFAVVAMGITLPWFACVVVAQREFAAHFLWKHHIVRFFAAFDHQAPFWYYLPTLLIGMFPCSLLAAPAVALLAGRSEALRTNRSLELGMVALAAGWIVLFFSASSCKLPTYVLPAIPLLCLIAGHVIDAAGRGAPDLPLARLTRYLPFCATVAAILIGAALAITSLWWRGHSSALAIVDWLVIVVPASLLAWHVVARGTRALNATSWTAAAATSILITVFAFHGFVPQFAQQRSVHANAARIQVDGNGQPRPVAYLDWQVDGQSLYFSQPTVDHFTQQDLAALARYVTRHGEVVFVSNAEGADQLRQRLGPSATFTRMPGARGRLYLVTAPSPHTSIATRP